jgi:NADH dehydrogenase
MEPCERTDIVIVGGGFGGITTALKLARFAKRRDGLKIHILSKDNFFFFTPFLVEVVTGMVETRHIVTPVRQLFYRTGVDFTQCEVKKIDPGERAVYTSVGVFPYDFLVIALGSVTNDYGLDGIAQNTFFLRSLEDALRLRRHIISTLERVDGNSGSLDSSLLTFIICGAGPTGIELACGMRDMFDEIVPTFYPKLPHDKIRIMVVEAMDRILPGFPLTLRHHVVKRLDRKRVEVLLSSPVDKANPDGILLADGSFYPSATVIWTAGIKAREILSEPALPKGTQGRIKVNDYLQVEGYEEIYALGDIAACPSNQNGLLPPEAQVAVQQARWLAAHIRARLEGLGPKKFRFYRYGRLLSLGSRHAVVSFLGVRLYGFIAWWFWRTAYLFKLRGFKNKLRVMIDWTMSLFFRRDMSGFG